MLIQNNIRPVFSFFNISCFISAERVQLIVQSHQLPQRVCGKIIDCLMPGPLTESRPYSLKHTHAEIDRHTLISTHIPKTPCWIIRGRRRVMRPGDRRDYWAKNIPLIIWTLFFNLFEACRTEVLTCWNILFQPFCWRLTCTHCDIQIVSS